MHSSIRVIRVSRFKRGNNGKTTVHTAEQMAAMHVHGIRYKESHSWETLKKLFEEEEKNNKIRLGRALRSNSVVPVKWSFSLKEFWQLCLKRSFLL